MKAIALVVGTKQTRTTGKLLSRVLHGDYLEDIMPVNHRYNLIWRWGNGHTLIPDFGGKIINRGSAVSKNKAQMRTWLLSKGVQCPKIFTSDTIGEAKYPLIARPVYHMRGRDFNIVENQMQAIGFLEHGYYLQEIVQNKDEFRVFAFLGKILECNIKVQVKEPRTRMNKLIKNFKTGYVFKRVRLVNMPANLITHCRTAQGMSGLDFCAIDCCVDNVNNPYIFELNAAPGLIERKAQTLCERILHHLGYEMPTERTPTVPSVASVEEAEMEDDIVDDTILPPVPGSLDEHLRQHLTETTFTPNPLYFQPQYLRIRRVGPVDTNRTDV